MMAHSVDVDEEAPVAAMGQVVHGGGAVLDAFPVRAREGGLPRLSSETVCELDGKPMPHVCQLHQKRKKLGHQWLDSGPHEKQSRGCQTWAQILQGQSGRPVWCAIPKKIPPEAAENMPCRKHLDPC